jgi:signal transduction histidine kinase
LHDFNNLLAGIAGHARLAKGCSSRQEADEALDELLKATDRCSQLVSRLRGGAQDNDPAPEGVAWPPIASEAISLLRSTLSANIKVRLSLDGARAAASCTESEAHQIVMNLALNAIDALGERGGTLTVSFRTEWLGAENGSARHEISQGHYVCLVVQDDGCGMDESTRQSVFEPFFSTKSPGSHRGLGLAIVQELVQRRRGFVEVDSKLGYGTRFRVYLPAVGA